MISVQIDSIVGSEIVTLTEAKDYARVDVSTDDDLITSMIKSAREKCEAIINRDIVSKTRSVFMSNMSSSGEYDELYARRTKYTIPYAPITSIQSVETQASDGSLSAISYDSYGLDDKYIELSASSNKNIKIAYTTSGMTNDDLKLAIKQLVATYYDNRSDFVTGISVNEIPSNVKSILSPYIFYNEL
tara:strand:+ start:1832 stop:2395 length:564 start_codon:yes stop_codon:yes gene_type:complete